VVNRDRHEIALEILREAHSGKKKTQLMSDVGLSYLQAKQYLATLVEKGLLETNERHQFKTTNKGSEFLERCGECLLFPWKKQRRKFAT
jgi:predicted transcriptional regulator